jgi:hypothetical protein
VCTKVVNEPNYESERRVQQQRRYSSIEVEFLFVIYITTISQAFSGKINICCTLHAVTFRVLAELERKFNVDMDSFGSIISPDTS